MSAAQGPDRWAAGRALLREADPRMAQLVDAFGERFRPWRTLAAAYLYASGEA